MFASSWNASIVSQILGKLKSLKPPTMESMKKASLESMGPSDPFIPSLESLKPKRPMKYPYTVAAKVIQFPYKFYFQNNWIWKYYPFGLLVSVPVFMYCSSLANKPSNVAHWKEVRRLEREEHHYHEK